LKTFNTISSEVFFTAEMEAFTHLQATNHRPAGLIEFYGGISCPPTYSIILEYMDRGDLEQYWKSTSAPVTEKDVHGFWAAFTALAEALAFLHEIPVQDGKRIWG
jgi:serine/threonine protein kinase